MTDNRKQKCVNKESGLANGILDEPENLLEKGF